MVDAAIELVLHPGTDIAARQKMGGAADQIVEVEETAPRLQPLVAADQEIGDDQRGTRGLQHAEKRDAVGEFEERCGKALKGLGEIREILGHTRRHDVPDTFRLQPRPVFREKTAAELAETGLWVGFRTERLQFGSEIRCRGFAGRGSAGFEQQRQCLIEIDIRPYRFRKTFRRVFRPEIEFGEERVGGAAADCIDEGAQIVATGDDLAQKCIEPAFAADRQHRLERAGEIVVRAGRDAGKKIAPRLADECRFHLRIQHLEMAGDVRFEREAVQDRFAEGVDGLYLQPARRFQRGGKEPAGAQKARAAGRTAFHLADRFGQFLVAERGPRAKLGEDSVRHVGGGRLGIGQAEDLSGLGSVEQQADDALRQDMRLAGTGVGGDPGGIFRIGGECLLLERIGRDDERPLHSPPSPLSPSSPAADHSCTRAR